MHILNALYKNNVKDITWYVSTWAHFQCINHLRNNLFRNVPSLTSMPYTHFVQQKHAKSVKT